MYLKSTSRYPVEEIRRLLAYAAEGFDLAHVAVHVKNTKRAYRGMAYQRVPKIANAHKAATRLVTISIGTPDKFPVDNMRTMVRWVTLRQYNGMIAQGLVERVIGLAHGSPEYDQWHRDHRVRLAGDLIDRVQRKVEERTPYGGKSSPLIELNNWKEAVVAIAAHEFQHIHQFQNKMSCSEVQCEKAAAKRLANYREAIQ